MLILNNTTDKIQAVLMESITTNQLQCVASWRDITTTAYTPGRTLINTNNTTDVDVVGAPASSTQRVIDYISVYNSDTVPATVIIKYDANGTEYILRKETLSANETLEYIESMGWSTEGMHETRVSVEMWRDGANTTDTNSPTALRFFKNLPYVSSQYIDLSPYKYVRFNVMKGATAGAADNKMILRYITDFSTTAANWYDIGTSEVAVATNVLNTPLTTGWIPLVDNAKGNVFIGIFTSGGDGVLDPQFGNIGAEFKS